MDLLKKAGIFFLSGSFFIASSLNGCRSFQTYPNYHIDKQIGDERIHFYESLIGKQNFLEITKFGDRMKRYLDTEGNDLRIESVEIYKDGHLIEKFDKTDPLGKSVLELEQIRFNNYLDMIKTEKLNQLNKHLE